MWYEDSIIANSIPIKELKKLNLRVNLRENLGLTHRNQSFSMPTAIGRDDNLQIALENYIRKLVYPYRSNLPPFSFSTEVRTQIYLTFIAIDGYLESLRPVLPETFLRENCFKYDFATWLKKTRSNSVIHSLEGQYLSIPENLDEYPTYYISDIGQILNYKYVFHWKEPCEDYLISLTPVSQEEERLEEFRLTLRGLLDDDLNVERIFPEEIMLENSGSTSLHGKDKEPFYQNRAKYCSYPSQKRGISKRCVIDVSPGGARDAIVTKPNDLLRIKLIDRQVRDILRIYFRKNILDSNPNVFELKYKRFQGRFKTFYCRDIEKEGLSKPRNLLRIMLEELHLKFPTFEAFESPGFYDDFDLELEDGSIIKTERGHGLGMANSLTTLMQIVIYNLTVALNNFSFKTSLIAENDDEVVGIDSESIDDIEEFINSDLSTCNDLGILIKREKSFFSQIGCVFCEKYHSSRSFDFNAKESYVNRALYLPLIASNITMAKFMCNSLPFSKGKYLERQFREIVSFWGYEFFPNEWEYPAEFGGWFSQKCLGVDNSLKEAYDDLKRDPLKAFYAIKESGDYRSLQRYNITGNLLYKSPIFGILPMPIVEDSMKLLFDIDTVLNIKKKYNKLYSKDYKKLTGKLLLKRRRCFAAKAPFSFFYDYCINSYIKSSDDVNWPETFYEDSVAVKSRIRQDDDIYSSSNPRLEYIKRHNPSFYLDVIENEFTLKYKNDSFKRVSKLEPNPDELVKMYSSVGSFEGPAQDFVPILDDDQYDLLSRSYIHPYAVYRMHVHTERNTSLKIPKAPYRKDVKNIREHMFPGILTSESEEYIELCLRHIPKKDMIFLMKDYSPKKIYRTLLPILRDIREEELILPTVLDIDRDDENIEPLTFRIEDLKLISLGGSFLDIPYDSDESKEDEHIQHEEVFDMDLYVEKLFHQSKILFIEHEMTHSFSPDRAIITPEEVKESVNSRLRRKLEDEGEFNEEGWKTYLDGFNESTDEPRSDEDAGFDFDVF